MAKVTVNIPKYRGTYELDLDRAFNTHEWRCIKRVSDYMPLTVHDGFQGGDPALFVALACIAMARDGRINRDDWWTVADDLGDAPFDGEAIVFEDEEATEETPLALTSKPDAPSPNGLLEKPSFSGAPSRSDSGLSDVTPPPTSLLRSGTSSV